VALFLVDTQGLFDIEASERDVTVMGTLNFLISSLQCFNVKERIDKVQLDYIFVSVRASANFSISILFILSLHCKQRKKTDKLCQWIGLPVKSHPAG